jgi:hypothetical protein
MKPFEFSVFTLASLGLVSVLHAAQPSPSQPYNPESTGRAPDRVQVSTESKNPLVVRIDPARVLDSSGQPIGKVENIVLNPSGCAEAAVITGERGRMIPVPWQVVKLSGETRGQGEAPGSGLVFTVNANNERILAALSFARDEWPNVASVSWLQPSVQFFRSDTAAGGTSDASSTAIGSAVSTTTTFTNAAGVVITNTETALPPTGRPGLPNVPPSVPVPNTPPPPAAVPPASVPQGSLPPPVTPQPPSSVPPQTFPRPVNPSATVP